MRFRRDAAALALVISATGVLVALPAAQAVRADLTVVLQVVPRGNGTVASSVADRTTGATTCATNQEPGACVWTFATGATVVLHAQPATGASFAGWSTQRCPGTADCRLTVDHDASVVALFSQLTLDVATSGAKSGDVITSNPPGINCPDTCSAAFDAKASVVLTVKTATGSTLTSFPYGCTMVQGNACTVTMLDQPQSVGVKLNAAEGPGQPDVVNVTVTVGKTGNGSGRVSAAGGLDCGGVCLAAFPYGTLARLSAVADPGSRFGGWSGLCASDSDPQCSLPIGPITLVRPSFLKNAPALSLRFVRSSTVSGRLVLRFSSARAAAGRATLFLDGKRLKQTAVSLRAGANALDFRLPRGAAGRHARLVLTFAGKTFTYRFVVPR